MKIVIINYGAGNIQSIKFAIQRLGYEAVLSNDETEIRNADKVIFPGVGEASSAMAKLKSTGLDKIIPTLKQPVLGICLGMQLMCNYCEEGDTLSPCKEDRTDEELGECTNCCTNKSGNKFTPKRTNKYGCSCVSGSWDIDCLKY